jgi:hypothetical protein
MRWMIFKSGHRETPDWEKSEEEWQNGKIPEETENAGSGAE